MTSIRPTQVTIQAGGRDARFFRAADDVLKNYDIVWNRRGKAFLKARVSGGTREYEVAIPRDGMERPTCTCPDSKKRAKQVSGGFCKHIIAVLMKSGESRKPEENFSDWLLDILL